MRLGAQQLPYQDQGDAYGEQEKGVCQGFVALTVILAVALGAAACVVKGSSDALAPDVVFHNGKIATVNAEFEMVEAVAVRAGRIVAVGSNDSVRALAADATRLVDLEGKTVLPGFHPRQPRPPEHGSGTKSARHRHAGSAVADEVLVAIEGKTAEFPQGEWIQVVLAVHDGLSASLSGGEAAHPVGSGQGRSESPGLAQAWVVNRTGFLGGPIP